MKPYFTYWLATISALILLASCKVGPDYRKPQPELPTHWMSGDGKAAIDPKAGIEQNWWKKFNDPVLDQLIAKALSGNPDLKIAEARIAEARATQASARADLLPVVNTVASGERQGNRLAIGNLPPGFDLAKPFNTFQAGFDASWELDLFGGRRREVESAGAALKASVASRDDARVSLLAEVARTYVDIRNYQAQLALTNDTIRTQQDTLKIASERFKAGEAPGLDATQAQAQLSQSLSRQPYYQNLLTQSELSMDVLLGDQPGATQSLITSVQPIPNVPNTIVLAAPANVIANRPDIRAAEYTLASATAQQGVATAQLFPDISLSGFFGILTSDAGSIFKAGNKSWDIGGNFLWPILNFNKVESGIDAANARELQAFYSYQKAVISALSDVERSVSALGKEQDHLAMLTTTADENRHALDIARARYKAGLSSFIEVLDAERTLYASQSQAANAEALAAQDTIAVYKSLGGGWK